MKSFLRSLALACTFAVCLVAPAQNRDSVRVPKDTQQSKPTASKNDMVSRVQAVAKEEVRRSAEKFRLTTSARKQEEEIEEERNTLLKANDYLKNGVDTNGLHAELQHLDARRPEDSSCLVVLTMAHPLAY